MADDEEFIKRRKWVTFFFLTSGLVPLIAARAESVYSGDYVPFFETTLVLAALSVSLAWGAGWSLYGESAGQNNERDDKPRLLNFLRFFLLRYFVGEALRSIYGLYIFVLFTVTLTAWLPDGFENGNIFFILASILYFLSSVFFTAWVYGPPSSSESGSVECLVYPLSIPNWKPEALKRADDVCEMLCRNLEFPQAGEQNRRAVRLNAVPLFAYLKRYPSIKQIVLLLTNQIVDGDERRGFPGLKGENGREYLESLFDAFESCGLGEFRIQWEDLFSSSLSPAPVENGAITVRLVRIGEFWDVRDIKGHLAESFKALSLEEMSSRVLIDITGGTAPVSAALILEAIIGEYRAGYVALPQDDLNDSTQCPVKDYVKEANLHVFEFEDIVNELMRYFERSYGGP